jgi:hypothetical protein
MLSSLASDKQWIAKHGDTTFVGVRFNRTRKLIPLLRGCRVFGGAGHLAHQGHEVLR